MKTMISCRWFALFGLVVLLLSGVPEAFARRVEECGTERVDYLRAPSCSPEAFFDSRSQACGPESYRRGEALSCAGSAGKDYIPICAEWNSPSSGCVGVCLPTCKRENVKPAGFKKQRMSSWGVDVDIPGDGYWVRPGRSFYCRKPEFGVELWKSCRDPSHGVELYKACVPQVVYNDCGIRKTRAELDSFLESTAQAVAITGPLLVSSQALIAQLKSNANSMACIIERWNGNPLHQGVVDQLKITYKNTTGNDFNSGSCDSEEDREDDLARRKEPGPQGGSCIPGEGCLDATPPGGWVIVDPCADENQSTLCKAIRDVRRARSYFAGVKNEISLLLLDVVVTSNASYSAIYASRLEEAQKQIAPYLE